MKVSTYDECVPLKIILQNFLNHVETLEAKRNEGDDQYEREFQELKLLSESLKGSADYSCKEGEKEVNRRKNRYKDILPFDSTRVTISEFPGVPGSNYINANYIRGASGSPAYIASQGPLANTLTDFWRMVVECEVQIIIMACNEEESGKHKCENYWLDVEDEVKISGPYTVRLLKARTVCPDFRLRTLELTYPNNEGELVARTVIQFHYCAWPDHGVPTLVRPLLDMVRLIRDCQVSETLPLLVHCSAGCGRTGTICAIDYVWGLLRAGKLTADFSLFNLISDMRKQRIAMVQTKEQYILVHRAVKELFLDQLKMIDAHPYENLDLHGRPLITPVHKIDPNYETIFIQNQDPGLESMVSEVSEQDDVCEDTDSENLPWPVVQLQATLANKTNLPKPKPQLATLPPLPLPSSPLDVSGDSTIDVNRNHTIKEPYEFSKEPSPLSQTRSSLIRRPSILKLKALFEKSPEPRNSSSPEKKSPHKKNSVKKASSFRLREEHFKSSKDGFRIMEFKEFCHPPKLSLASEFHADSETEPILPASTDDKPVLPIKRSKSMKVYRDFDLEQRKKMIVEPIQVDVITPPSFEYVQDPGPAPLESVVKNLVVSSLDRGSRESKYTKQEPVKASDAIDYKEAMWSGTCGSLDRVLKSEEVGKGTAGADSVELPRTESQTVPIFKAESGPVKDLRPAPQYVSPVQGKASTGSNTTPYANVTLLKRTTPLDDDARQVLKNCQAYLADDVPLPLAGKRANEKKQSPLTSPAKVQAVVATETPADLAQIARDARDRLAKLVGAGAPPAEGRQRQRRDSFKQAVWVGGADNVVESPVPSTKTKNANDYEAIWLSGKSPGGAEISQDEGGGDEDEVDSNAPAPIAMEPVYVNLPSVKRGIQVHNAPPVSQAQLTEARNLDFQAKLVKEAIFVQKSGEISHLLSELRVTAEPGATSSPASQRSRDDYAKISKKHSVPLGVVSPSATRKAPPYVNYPQPPARSGAPAPVRSPSSGKKAIASYFYPAPLDSLNSELAAKHKALTPSTSLYVTFPPEGGGTSSAAGAKDNASRQRRREPPKYQAPPDPPCKRLPGEVTRPPIAPPRGVKRISSLGNLPLDGMKENANVAPLADSPGSFRSSPVGVDIDAVAASINLSEGTKPTTNETWSGSPLANKALSKALGKFHATAQSLKTKFVQLGDALDSGTSSKNATVAPEAENSRSERTRSSSDKSRQPVGFPPDTVPNTRKKQQYL